MAQPTQLPENSSDAPSSSSPSFDDDSVRASCLINFVVGEVSRVYIGNGGLVSFDLVLVAREILKDYEGRTLEKNLYLHPANVASDKYIAQVYAIIASPYCGISVARVSKLLNSILCA